MSASVGCPDISNVGGGMAGGEGLAKTDGESLSGQTDKGLSNAREKMRSEWEERKEEYMSEKIS